MDVEEKEKRKAVLMEEKEERKAALIEEKEERKAALLSHLVETGYSSHRDPAFFHGRMFQSSALPEQPAVEWECSFQPRMDEEAPKWLTATEYLDSDTVCREKVEKLAELLKLSERTVVYSGAGISVSAGVGQAARGGVGYSDITTDAAPSVTHRVLAALQKAGLLHGWIQQNHDGLPQKAGFPQEDIIEIHGSWFDPSNPVVCMSGIMRKDLYSRMSAAITSADLVLVLGTSLSGLNSDQVAVTAARRSREGRALGTVIINLQQTARDGESTLRLFSHTDSTLQSLADLLHLKLQEEALQPPLPYTALVPYSPDGRRSENVRMTLDLNKGQRIRLNPDHNCQGSRQPKLLHVFGNSGGFDPYQIVCRPPGPGEGTVEAYDPVLSGWEVTIEGVTLLLGGWWLEAAARGKPATIPVINMEPRLGLQEGDRVRMVDEAGSDQERQALVVRIAEEIERDKRIEAEQDYAGLIPEVYQATATALLGELQEDSMELEKLVEGMRSRNSDALSNAKRLVEEGDKRRSVMMDFIGNEEETEEEMFAKAVQLSLGDNDPDIK